MSPTEKVSPFTTDAPARKKKRRSKGLVPIVLSAIFLLGFIAYGIHLKLDEPRRTAELSAKIESKGGKVVERDWGDGYRVAGSNHGYVGVIFDGQTSRCSLSALLRDPAILDCDPAVKR